MENHAKNYVCNAASSLSANPYFSTSSHHIYQFQKNVTGPRGWACNCSVKFSIKVFVLKVVELHIIINVHRFIYKVPLISGGF